jgi:hypothetical protein
MRLFYLLPIALLATACASRSHSVRSSEPRQAAGFSSIVANGSVDIHVVVGPEYSVTVRCEDAKSSRYVETRVDGDRLIVDAKMPEHHWMGLVHYSSDEECSVDVALPKLESIAVNGSGDVDIASARTSKLDLSMVGSGDVRVRDLEANEVFAKMNGSGDLELSGKAKVLHVQSNGSGDVDAGRFKTEESRVESNGSGDVHLSASRRADVRTNGSGDIMVLGHPAERLGGSNGAGEIRWE